MSIERPGDSSPDFVFNPEGSEPPADGIAAVPAAAFAPETIGASGDDEQLSQAAEPGARPAEGLDGDDDVEVEEAQIVQDSVRQTRAAPPERETVEPQADPDEAPGAVTERTAQSNTAAAGVQLSPRETTSPAEVAVRPPEKIEIPIADRLQPQERAGIQQAAAVLNKAGASAGRHVSFAVTRGLTIAAEHARSADTRPPDSGEPTSSDNTSLAIREESATTRMTFSLARLEDTVAERIDTSQTQGPEPAQSLIRMTPQEEQRAAQATMWGIGGAHKESKKRAYERQYNRMPRQVPHDNQLLAAYERGVTKAQQERTTRDPVAAGMAATIRLRQISAQHFRDWELRARPELDLPLKVRPDDPDPWEERDAAGMAFIEPGATDVDALAAMDDLRQKRAAEQYEWDWQYDPYAHGVRQPQRIRPPDLTNSQRQHLYDDMIRQGASDYMAQAVVDSKVQELDNTRYHWDLEFLRLQGSPEAEYYPILPCPPSFTPSQLRALRDDAYLKMFDEQAADAEVEALIEERQQQIDDWNRDYHNRQPGATAETARAGQITLEDFLAMGPDRQLQVLQAMDARLMENESQRVPSKAPEWRRLTEQRALFSRHHASFETDTSGQARQRAVNSRTRAGKTIPGYRPEENIRTAVVFGSKIDMSPVVCVTVGGCEQVFTVGGHNSGVVNKVLGQQLSRNRPVNMEVASPFLDPGITADVVTVNPGAGAFIEGTRELPHIRPGGSLIIAGSPTERWLIRELTAQMAKERAAGDTTGFLDALPLEDGTLEITPDGEPDRRSPSSPRGVIFLARH